MKARETRDTDEISRLLHTTTRMRYTQSTKRGIGKEKTDRLGQYNRSFEHVSAGPFERPVSVFRIGGGEELRPHRDHTLQTRSWSLPGTPTDADGRVINAVYTTTV